MDGPAPRRRGRPRARGGLRRHQGARRRRAAVAAAAAARPRHRPVPGHQLPHLRHGGHAGRLPGRAVPRRSPTIDPRRRRPRPVPLGERPRQPHRRARRPRRRGRVGREHGVPVLSDECYVEFTWDGPPRTILEHGPEGVLAVHSLSKRSNLAGVRAGVYAGDPELVRYLSEVRKHAGFMVPGPVQAAAVAAWGDDAHVDEQRRALPRPPRRHGHRARQGGRRRRRCPPAPSTSGRPPPTATPGRWLAAWPRPAAPSCRPASSTDRRAPASCAWRSSSPTTASPSWPSASPAAADSPSRGPAARVVEMIERAARHDRVG